MAEGGCEKVDGICLFYQSSASLLVTGMFLILAFPFSCSQFLVRVTTGSLANGKDGLPKQHDSTLDVDSHQVPDSAEPIFSPLYLSGRLRRSMRRIRRNMRCRYSRMNLVIHAVM